MLIIYLCLTNNLDGLLDLYGGNVFILMMI